MKRLLLGILALASFFQIHAEDYKFLAFQTSDGAVQTISVDALKITFANGQLQATSGATTLSISLDDLTKMYFTETSGIKDLTIESDTAADGIYTLQGIKVDHETTLPQGVYIVKKNGKTQKVTLK